MICAEHNKEFNGPNSRGNYWHVIDFAKKEFCNMPAPKPAVTPAIEAKTEEIKSTLAAPVVTVETPVYFDKRSFRIERQHSQEMAIKFLELLAKVTPEAFMEMKKPLKDMVKDYTDHFHSDLESSSQADEENIA